ncbi:MAG: 4a-hydroxytetrahydrobiopterin dehydratase [Paracoccus sp. (in: a-proteobacteria)]|nr:4a-hydroxytetrahydrobiopterin dehydratase [Paracoccus sp. (in: a-proteobacteria)]
MASTHILDEAQIRHRLRTLDGWELDHDAAAGRTCIRRRFGFKGFSAAVEMANLAAWLGNRIDHHPDISFGWGYCTVTFTTHDAGGVTEADLAAAARLNAVLA